MKNAWHTISPHQPWFSIPFSTRVSCCFSQLLLCNKPPQNAVFFFFKPFILPQFYELESPSYILTFFILFLHSFLSSFAGFT